MFLGFDRSLFGTRLFGSRSFERFGADDEFIGVFLEVEGEDVGEGFFFKVREKLFELGAIERSKSTRSGGSELVAGDVREDNYYTDFLGSFVGIEFGDFDFFGDGGELPGEGESELVASGDGGFELDGQEPSVLCGVDFVLFDGGFGFEGIEVVAFLEFYVHLVER